MPVPRHMQAGCTRARFVGLAAVCLAFCCFDACVVQAFYIPGVSPVNYPVGDIVKVKSEALSSSRTQLPYEYFSLPFCKPEGELEAEQLNLGEVLAGARVYFTGYEFSMMHDERCKILCRTKLTKDQVDDFASMVEEDYRAHFILDNLPLAVVSVHETEDGPSKQYDVGYPIGAVHTEAVVDTNDNAEKDHDSEHEDDEHDNQEKEGSEAEVQLENNEIYLHNHLSFKVLVHTEEGFDGFRIVGFEVEPSSIQHKAANDDQDFRKCNNHVAGEGGRCELASCSADGLQMADHELEMLRLDNVGEDGTEIFFTYDVKFQQSDIKWASRWDLYLEMQDEEVHWFSILNSFMIVLFLTALIAMILSRALRKDFQRYEQAEFGDDVQEETGWKLVHGDVFRAPEHPTVFAAVVGSGVQVALMLIILLTFASLGFLSPANRGGFASTAVFLFAFMGVSGGYFAARLFKTLRGTSASFSATRLAILVATLFPATAFSIFFVLNLFVWSQKSSGAVPFSTLLALLLMWFGITSPLVFLGVKLGLRKDPYTIPVRINQIARQIPTQPWYLNKYLCYLLCGILPFGAVFLELFFILTSLWMHQMYYLFGFLALVLVILFVTCAEITIVLVYFQLCAEDWSWWWRSLFTSGACSFYLFISSVFYFYSRIQATRFVTSLLFFGYMGLFSFAFFLFTGATGFLATFVFVKKIYGAIKID